MYVTSNSELPAPCNQSTGPATSHNQSTVAANMETWLGRLERQLSASLPKEPKSFVPSLDNLYRFADCLVMGADSLASADGRGLSLGWTAAFQNEVALVASLVIGRFCPPIRLAVIRSILHPSITSAAAGTARRGTQRMCEDRDCRDPSCVGNRVEISGEEPSDVDRDVAGPDDHRRVKFCAPHHKNERRGFAAIEFMVPEGPLTKMILLHVQHGHRVLTQASGEEERCLFVSRVGRSFTAVTFCHFWKTIMGAALGMGIPYFRPSLARTAFIDMYTSMTGMNPTLWDGAATIMGNTVGLRWARFIFNIYECQNALGLGRY